LSIYFDHAADYGRPHETEFVPLLRATILVTGYALPAVGLFIMRQRAVNTAGGGMYV
jgi:hypothetical protein